MTNFHPLTVGIQQDPIEYPNEILGEMNSAVKLPGGVILANGARCRDIRVGELLARLTGDVVGVGLTGQYIARKAAQLTVAAAMGATSFTVGNPWPFSIGDTVVIDDGSNAADAVVITDINYTTGVITTAALANGTNPLPIGSKVTVTASGQSTAVGIAAERYSYPSTRTGLNGRTSMYIEGIFKKWRLYNGIDTAAVSDLNAVDIIAPEGTLVRISKT